MQNMIFHFKSFWDLIFEIEDDFMESLNFYSVVKIGRDFRQLFTYFFIKRLNVLLDKNANILIDWHPYPSNSIVARYYSESDYLKECRKIFNKFQKLLPFSFIETPYKKDGIYNLENLDYDIFQQIIRNYQKKADFTKIIRMLKKLLNTCEKQVKIQNFYSAINK